MTSLNNVVNFDVVASYIDKVRIRLPDQKDQRLKYNELMLNNAATSWKMIVDYSAVPSCQKTAFRF